MVQTQPPSDLVDEILRDSSFLDGITIDPIPNDCNLKPIPPIHPNFTELSSSRIERSKLKPVHHVLSTYSDMIEKEKIGQLAVKLSKEAIFGDSVLQQCTPRGWPGVPALPQRELGFLKRLLYEQFTSYHSSPGTFEKKWTTAQDAVGQACKRLRKKANFSRL
jgi:hypothetical protein